MKSIRFLSILILAAVSTVSKAQVINEFETESLGDFEFISSSFLSDDEGWLADNAGNLWSTTDGGGNWTITPVEINFLKLDFADASNGYGITANIAYKTTDGGASWSAVTLPGAVGKAIQFLDVNTGFISGPEVVYKTTDGGLTWTTVATPGASMLDFYFINGSVGIAAARDGDTYQSIWRTADGGASWSAVFTEEGFYINAIWFTNENVGWAAGGFARSGYGILPAINKTTDGGLTWVNVFMNENPGDLKGETFLDIRFRNQKLGLAISSYSENVFTIDGGNTWIPTYGGPMDVIPSHGVYRTLDGNHKMYIAGRKGHFTLWD